MFDMLAGTFLKQTHAIFRMCSFFTLDVSQGGAVNHLQQTHSLTHSGIGSWKMQDLMNPDMSIGMRFSC